MKFEAGKYYRHTQTGNKVYCVGPDESGVPMLHYPGESMAFRTTTPDQYEPWVEPVKPLECWVNVYPDGMNKMQHNSREEADRYARPDRIRCAHLVEVQEP